jgi:hypothetical protein
MSKSEYNSMVKKKGRRPTSGEEMTPLSALQVAPASRVWSASIATGPYRGGRSKHWIKVKNRTHPAMVLVMEGFARHARFHSLS